MHAQKSGLPDFPVPGAQQIVLTRDQYYDTRSYTGLPALEDGKTIAYSVVEEGIYTSGNEPITEQFARSSSISGTGWYVVHNQPAVSVTIRKEWVDQDGENLAMRKMRKHVAWYTVGCRHASKLRGMSNTIATMEDLRNLLTLLEP